VKVSQTLEISSNYGMCGQKPKVHKLLTEFMKGKHYPEGKTLFKNGDIVTLFCVLRFFTFSVLYWK